MSSGKYVFINRSPWYMASEEMQNLNIRWYKIVFKNTRLKKGIVNV